MLGILKADARSIPLADESVQCVVTSPPYFGLRKYSGEQELVWGGRKGCQHTWGKQVKGKEYGRHDTNDPTSTNFGGWSNWSGDTGSAAGCYCLKCPVWRGAYGLEPTVEMYVQHTVEILREIRRVLRDDGVVFWNIGDSYATQPAGNKEPCGFQQKSSASKEGALAQHSFRHGKVVAPSFRNSGLKPKDLCLIPFRVAQELQKPYYTGQIKSENDRVWLACAIEAEGSFFVARHPKGTPTGRINEATGERSKRGADCFNPGISIVNTSEKFILRCKEIACCGGAVRLIEANGNRRRYWEWRVYSDEARKLIQEIYPYLIAKHHEARIGYRMSASGGDAEKSWLSMKLLHKGQAPTIDFAAPPKPYEPGWWIRSDIVWSKPNPMPESVTDRPTRSHEYILMLTKNSSYYWDAEAVAEPLSPVSIKRYQSGWDGNEKRDWPGTNQNNFSKYMGSERAKQATHRNLRSVWEFTTQSYPESHFATFPEELPRRCILAATRPGDLVLDPFAGSGTVGKVAIELGRRAILCDLAYQDLASKRTAELQRPLLI